MNPDAGWVISVVAESMPHLKRGAMRDFAEIVRLSDQNFRMNKTDSFYSIGKNIIEFFPADDASKLRGGRRDYLFVNECNNVTFDSWTQLVMRTKVRSFGDFNPVSSFWAHEKVIPREDCTFIKSTYEDNPYIPQASLNEILSYRDTPGMEHYWQVYGLGEVGSIEGVVFPVWDMVDEMPECKVEVLGLDFGFTNDPTAIILVGVNGDHIYLDQLVYQTGLTNQDICHRLRALNIDRRTEIYADSAEPKSIEEIYREGFNIHPAAKGKDSVAHGIDLLRRKKIHVTKASIDLIRELRNYTWKVDRGGNKLNAPIDDFNHAIDAVRYAASAKLIKRPGKIQHISV